MIKEMLPTFCFGKLPAFNDFVRCNATSREAQTFDQWLQQGLLAAQGQAGPRWETIYAHAPVCAFLFYPENARQFLVGVFKTSRDKTERKFPFLVSLQVNMDVFDMRFRLFAPVIFQTFLENASGWVGGNPNPGDSQEIAWQVEQFSQPVPENYLTTIKAYRDYLSATTAERFWISQFGSFEDPRKYLLFKNLTDILLPLRQRDLSRFAIGLRFPLESEPQEIIPRIFLICFWQEVVLQLLGNPALLPVLFWTVSEDIRPAYLYLYFRPPGAKDFLHFIYPEHDSDTLCKVDSLGKELLEQAKRGLAPKYMFLLDSRPVSMADFLKRL